MNSVSNPAAEVSKMMIRTSWIGFWVQVVLGVISTIILLFSAAAVIPRAGVPGAANPGTGAGLLFAAIAVGVLYFSAYQTFRNTLYGRKLLAPKNVRPTRADTLKLLRFNILVNLGGLGAALMGAEAITGNLLAKALVQPNAINVAALDPSKFVQPLDIFVVLGNTHTLVAHFAGLLVSLRVIDRIASGRNS
ncbi:MAG: DUF3611 family protein [Cyanobacteria bacterium P01_H01_bin.130]